MAISRRAVLGVVTAGFTTLVMFEVGCGGGDSSPGPGPGPGPNPPPGGSTCDGASSRSTVDDGHSHSVCVPNADLESPPSGGRTYQASFISGHTHTISLSEEELTTIAGGGTVTVTSSSDDGHTHDFSIRRA